MAQEGKAGGEGTDPAIEKFKLHQCPGLKKSSPDPQSCKPTTEPARKSIHISESPQRGRAKPSDTRGFQVQNSATYWSKGPRKVQTHHGTHCELGSNPTLNISHVMNCSEPVFQSVKWDNKPPNNRDTGQIQILQDSAQENT